MRIMWWLRPGAHETPEMVLSPDQRRQSPDGPGARPVERFPRLRLVKTAGNPKTGVAIPPKWKIEPGGGR